MLQYQREEAGKFLQVGKQHMTKRSLHFAIRKETPGAQEIMDKFNTAITEMMIDGTYNRILKLQWIQADVDGDGRLDLVAADKFAGSDKPIGGYNVLFPDMKFEGETKPSNYYIDGKKYDGWDNIPNDYKIDATSSRKRPPPVNAFTFPY